MTAAIVSKEWRPFHRHRYGLRRRRTSRIPTSRLHGWGRIYRKRSGNLVLWMAWRGRPADDRIYDVCGTALTYSGAFRKALRAIQVLADDGRPFEWRSNDLRIRRAAPSEVLA